MRLLKQSIWIARSREAVFDLFVDFKQAARWRSYVTSMEPVGDGPIGAGTKLRVTMQLSGEPYVNELTVLVCERPSLWRHHSNEPDYKGYVEYRFESEGEGTRVTMSMVAKPRSLHGWLGLPLLWLSRNKGYPDHLPQLKRVAEEP